MTQNAMSYPKELRWWFEEWKPKHGRGCDGKECYPPLMSVLKSAFKSSQSEFELKRVGYREPEVTVDSIYFSRTYVHKAIKLLESHGLIHGCYATGWHRQTVYKLGSAEDCASPEHH